MKNIVPVPVTCSLAGLFFPTPQERRRPNSFDNNLFLVYLLGPWSSLSILPFLLSFW